MAGIKKLIKLFVPPLVFKIANRFKKPTEEVISWKGQYGSYQEAYAHSEGYDSDAIFEKVKSGILKVKSGEAVFERDSVVFSEMEYNWPLLATLLKLSCNKPGVFHIADFGGSLGSTYFQCRNFLSNIALRWTVVEQEHFIRFGQEKLEDKQLKFAYDLETASKHAAVDVVLFSSVLQYLPEPEKIISEVKKIHAPFIIIDRTSFTEGPEEMWTVQTVHEPIYEASYPAYFFKEDLLISRFEPEYRLAYKFENNITDGRIINNVQCKWTGLVLERK